MIPAPSAASGRISPAAALAGAQEQLTQAGVASPRADAEWLLADILGVDRGMLVVADDLDAATAAAFRAAVARRAQRIPLQHITSEAAFGPVELAVGPGVFIPRPETEWLLDWAVRHLADIAAPLVVDLCSGSGALAIAIAASVPAARVIAVEKSDDALIWLRRNVSEVVGESRVTVVDADVTDHAGLLERLAAHGVAAGEVDLIVSNPPYVPLHADVAAEVAHDPAMAVFGGVDGMSVIVPMLEGVVELLAHGAPVGIEHDDTTSDAVVAACTATGRLDQVTAHRDLAGRQRFATAVRG